MAAYQFAVNVGLIGFGTVGSGVARIFLEEAELIFRKTGVKLNLKKICVRSKQKKRAYKVPPGLITDNPLDILEDNNIQIVIELIGGTKTSKEIILKAFQSGKHVVTANKALLSEKADEIFDAAVYYQRQLRFEASVCGGVPVLKVLREGLASNRITRILGIVNGTCNYILTQMSEQGETFENALIQAQRQGYAEADPTLDVEGVDSAHKLSILGRQAFASKIDFKQIPCQGIHRMDAKDIAYAKELGYQVKLIAMAKRHKDSVELRVAPTLLPMDHPMAGVRGSYNAVYVQCSQADDQLFYGRGAGQMPTASAVMADVIDIAKNILAYGNKAGTQVDEIIPKAKMLNPDLSLSKYYLRFQVADRPGVLGQIAQTLGRFGISILSVHQKESHDKLSTPVVILTYESSQGQLKKAVNNIDKQSFSRQKAVMLRVER